MKPLYFDNHATTPVDPKVLNAMLPFFSEDFGNPESVQHTFGWKARAAVDEARAQVASIISAEANEIVFTSGATESIHFAIIGAMKNERTPRHIITAATEHKATLGACAEARKLGHEVSILPVDRFGQVSVQQVESALLPTTSLVTLMHGNNEIGTLHPVKEIGAMLAQHGIAFHVDAAQTIGKCPINVKDSGITTLSLSGHKMYAPKGIGAIFIRRGTHLAPLFPGGSQERGQRSGTLNVPGIVGLGAACAIAQAELVQESEKLRTWRDAIISSVRSVHGVRLNGHPTERLVNNINITLEGVDSDRLLLELKDIAYSSASACSSGGPSHVLEALGENRNDPFVTTMRIGLGRFNTIEEVTILIQRLKQAIANAREFSKG